MDTERHREDGDVKMEAATWVMWLLSQAVLRTADGSKKLGEQSVWFGFSLAVSRSNQLCRCLDFRLLASRTGRKSVSVVLGHLAYDRS